MCVQWNLRTRDIYFFRGQYKFMCFVLYREAFLFLEVLSVLKTIEKVIFGISSSASCLEFFCFFLILCPYSEWSLI